MVGWVRTVKVRVSVNGCLFVSALQLAGDELWVYSPSVIWDRQCFVCFVCFVIGWHPKVNRIRLFGGNVRYNMLTFCFFQPSRISSPQHSAQILQEVGHKIQSYPFSYQGATILSGQEEGAYGWVTVNYLLENFIKVWVHSLGIQLILVTEKVLRQQGLYFIKASGAVDYQLLFFKALCHLRRSERIFHVSCWRSKRVKLKKKGKVKGSTIEPCGIPKATGAEEVSGQGCDSRSCLPSMTCVTPMLCLWCPLTTPGRRPATNKYWHQLSLKGVLVAYNWLAICRLNWLHKDF